MEIKPPGGWKGACGRCGSGIFPMLFWDQGGPNKLRCCAINSILLRHVGLEGLYTSDSIATKTDT